MYEQYEAWNALVEEFGDQGFTALAVPSNNFGLQEPGENADLLNGIRWVRPGGNFTPDFRVCGKTEVNGDKQNPVHEFLKERCPNPQSMITDTNQIYWTPVRQSDITWNFEKFLIDHEGKPYKRYVPAMNPQNPLVRNDIQTLLDRKKAADESKVNHAKKNVNRPTLADIIIKKSHH